MHMERRAAPPSGRTPRWRSRSGRSAAVEGAARPDPGAVLKIVERVMCEGDVRSGTVGADLGPQDALALLRAWLDAMELEIDERRLLGLLQDGELSHPDLYRRARRIHERKLAAAVNEVTRDGRPAPPASISRAAREPCSTPASPRSRTPPRAPSSGARS